MSRGPRRSTSTTPTSPSTSRFDIGFAIAYLAACEVELAVVAGGPHSTVHGPIALGVLGLALLSVPVAWRRQQALVLAGCSTAGLLVLQFAVVDLTSLNLPQLALLIPPYAVGAYAARRSALVGLAVCMVPVVAVNADSSGQLSSWIFSVVAVAASWSVGRMIHSRRSISAALAQTEARIASERDSLERLSVAEQRTRIAQELQGVVAESVAIMIVQAETARRVLEGDLFGADAAMATIEELGRHALGDMRRILGVLRHADAALQMEPLPGIGQIAALVERRGSHRHPITLLVEGEPRPVPASLELAVYRILEEALTSVSDHPAAVHLKFEADRVELTVVVPPHDAEPLEWPTANMCDLTRLCNGAVEVAQREGQSTTLAVKLPIRVTQGVT